MFDASQRLTVLHLMDGPRVQATFTVSGKAHASFSSDPSAPLLAQIASVRDQTNQHLSELLKLEPKNQKNSRSQQAG